MRCVYSINFALVDLTDILYTTDEKKYDTNTNFQKQYDPLTRPQLHARYIWTIRCSLVRAAVQHSICLIVHARIIFVCMSSRFVRKEFFFHSYELLLGIVLSWQKVCILIARGCRVFGMKKASSFQNTNT